MLPTRRMLVFYVQYFWLVLFFFTLQRKTITLSFIRLFLY